MHNEISFPLHAACGAAYLTAPNIAARHAFSTRLGGVSTGVLESLNLSVRRGDTLCTGKKKIEFAGIPTFSPEHFARIEQKDTMKRKQFVKGMEQIAQEGAIQIFREVGGGMEEVVVGVVGVLQLEVLEYRLNTEYNVEIRMQQLPFEQLRWIQNDPDTYVLRDLDLTSDTKAVEDMKGNRLLLFTSDWAIRWAETHNETLKLSEFGNI